MKTPSTAFFPILSLLTLFLPHIIRVAITRIKSYCKIFLLPNKKDCPKMKAKIILVEPEYPENIGLISRAAKNFGLEEILIVKPKTGFHNAKARSRAMHAADLLEKAKVFPSLEKAVEEVDYAIATTAKLRSRKKIFRTAVTPKKLAEKFSKSNATIGIVFGREGTGLTNEEIKQCDFVVSIPTSRAYRTLNVSHSAAIILCELFASQKKVEFKSCKQETKKLLEKKLDKILAEAKTIENKNSVRTAFRALLGRALLTEKEALAIIALFAEFEKSERKD